MGHGILLLLVGIVGIVVWTRIQKYCSTLYLKSRTSTLSHMYIENRTTNLRITEVKG
jgi:hypothetical protein